MLKPKILVTGATGKTGSLVVAELLKGPAIRTVNFAVRSHQRRNFRLTPRSGGASTRT
jgi:uncharacterized protein YbjT (DUF2867 family)